jgi:hypothetical protein
MKECVRSALDHSPSNANQCNARYAMPCVVKVINRLSSIHPLANLLVGVTPSSHLSSSETSILCVKKPTSHL